LYLFRKKSMHRKNKFQKLVPLLFITTILLSSFQTPVVTAQGKDGLKRQANAQTGKVSFIGPETGRALPASKALGTFIRPQDPALALAKRFAPEFGIKNPERDLMEIKKKHAEDGRITVRYQQKYQDIPVIGAELIVNTNVNGDLYSINGEVSPNLSLLAQPKIDPEQATQTARQALAMWYQKSPADFVASTPELWIYDESLLRPSKAPAELVWRIEVTAKDAGLSIRELVLVNAQRGNMGLHFNQIDSFWQDHTSTVHIPDLPPTSASGLVPTIEKSSQGSLSLLSVSPEMTLLFAPLVRTYTAEHTSSLPGIFLCDQTDPDCSGEDAHAQAAHKYAIGTSNLYAEQFNRNSIDNHGMTIISTVHYCDLEDPILGCPYFNAFWNGEQMVYGDALDFPLADDVVGHELTHGVTQYESNLFYYYQSGAINESFSDVFGEYYDQTNGYGNDAPDVKWLIGEEVSEEEDFVAIRSMSDPPAFDNPDKISSPLYYKEDGDNGGVHYNSGINNKAVYLMVDGGTFNGKTVVTLGWDKVNAIYYEVNTNLLTSGSDYSDLYYALQQACTNLLGQHGLTSGDCIQVKNAADAVEMNGQPEPNFNTHAPLCNDGSPVNTFFYDNLENGTSNWTFNNGTYLRWQLDSPDGAYARSGFHSLFANGQPGEATDATARLVPILIPTNGYLHFEQAYGFVSLGEEYYLDGGVLEYSTNGGNTWLDAGSLIDYNGYEGSIFTDFGNPLAGRSGFVGASHGYISTRLNLSSLAGQSITFRWRMGLGDFNFFGESWGWWLDDIRVFNCVPFTITGNVGVAGATLTYTGGSTVADGSGNYSFTVPYGWSGTVTPSLGGDAFCPGSKTYNNVTANQTSQNYAHTTCPQFDPMTQWTADYSYNLQQWRVEYHPRLTGDVDGDGDDDIVGFGYDRVLVALSNGANGFAPMTQWTTDFSYNAQGWRTEYHPRLLGDVNGDGRADIVGFGYDRVLVALSTGTSFAPMTQWTTDFSYNAQGWRVEKHPRLLGDVNNDGRDDIVGFGNDRVLVALSTGTSFAPMTQWTTDFSYNAQGWRVESHPRLLGDVNGDGRADIVGFGNDRVLVALSTGTSFAPMSQWTTDFSYNAQQWRVEYHPRLLADVNNDGKDDIVGFGYDRVLVALSNGSGFASMVQATTDYSYNLQQWRVEYHPRLVGDVNDDGKADLVGFGYDRVLVAAAAP
jgi:bacillolysin